MSIYYKRLCLSFGFFRPLVVMFCRAGSDVTCRHLTSQRSSSTQEKKSLRMVFLGSAESAVMHTILSGLFALTYSVSHKHTHTHTHFSFHCLCCTAHRKQMALVCLELHIQPPAWVRHEEKGSTEEPLPPDNEVSLNFNNIWIGALDEDKKAGLFTAHPAGMDWMYQSNLLI